MSGMKVTRRVVLGLAPALLAGCASGPGPAVWAEPFQPRADGEPSTLAASAEPSAATMAQGTRPMQKVLSG
jgi:hypothetical protein